MSAVIRRWLVAALCLILLHLETAQAAHDTIEVRAYANDACIVAEPADSAGALQQARAKYFDALVELLAASPGTAH